MIKSMVYQYGQFKTKFPNDKDVLSKINNVDFSKDFIHNFYIIFEHYKTIKSNERIFSEDCLYIKVIELLDFFKLPSFEFAFENGPKSFNQSQKALFDNFIRESAIAIENGSNLLLNLNNQNISSNSNFRKSLNDIQPTAFVNFNDSRDFISSLFNKKFRYQNHLKIIKTHFDNNTTPSKLFYRNFPAPQFFDDADYIKEYNDLITEFQKSCLNLSKKYFERRFEIIESKLFEIKENLEKVNSSDNIEHKFKDLHDSSLKNLDEYFKKSNDRALRAKAVPFKVGQVFSKKIKFSKHNNTKEFHHNDSINYDTTANNTSMSSTSTSRSILRNNNRSNTSRQRGQNSFYRNTENNSRSNNNSNSYNRSTTSHNNRYFNNSRNSQNNYSFNPYQASN